MRETSTALAESSPKTKHLQRYQFKAGQSGNPGGRTKGTTLREMKDLARTHFEVAAKRLVELIHSRDEAIALQAVQFVYLYSLGKPQEGGDIEHREARLARSTELIAVPVNPEPAPELPAPPEAESVVAAPSLTAKAESNPPPVELPPEATGAKALASVPSGLRCLYRGKEGQCQELALGTSQWCAPHRAKLFSMVPE